MQIGNVTVRNNIFLAPLAGFTDASFRALCNDFGAGLTFSEMVSAKAIVYNNANTKKLLENKSHVRPWAVQFFGHEPDVFTEAIKRLRGEPFDIVDINMGCPVPKIVKNGEGCALMNDPALAGRIIEAAVKASGRPVTVKIRKGFSQVNAVEMAEIAEASGASMVTVHGRTRAQFYSGEADWDIIKKVKSAVKIPVIGNGDVFTPQAAAKLLKETDCDGVMLARGALGNPWLFTQIVQQMETGNLPVYPSWEERKAVALNHVRDVVSLKGENHGIREMRKQLCFYIKGLTDAAQMRKKNK
jgi:nifR3 family TIM-barrel protein